MSVECIYYSRNESEDGSLICTVRKGETTAYEIQSSVNRDKLFKYYQISCDRNDYQGNVDVITTRNQRLLTRHVLTGELIDKDNFVSREFFTVFNGEALQLADNESGYIIVFRHSTGAKYEIPTCIEDAFNSSSNNLANNS